MEMRTPKRCWAPRPSARSAPTWRPTGSMDGPSRKFKHAVGGSLNSSWSLGGGTLVAERETQPGQRWFKPTGAMVASLPKTGRPRFSKAEGVSRSYVSSTTGTWHEAERRGEGEECAPAAERAGHSRRSTGSLRNWNGSRLDNYWAGRCSWPGLHGPCGAQVESRTCSNGHTVAAPPTTHLPGNPPEVLSGS